MINDYEGFFEVKTIDEMDNTKLLSNEEFSNHI